MVELTRQFLITDYSLAFALLPLVPADSGVSRQVIVDIVPTMVKWTSTTVSSAAVLFVAACTSDVVHLALGASYDLQVHTCITLDAETFDPVGFKFCTAGQECVTWLLAAPLAAGASITDGLVADSDYTFTLSLGSGVSTVELFLASDDAW